MKKMKFLLLVVLAVCLASSVAWADFMVTSSGGSWQAVPTDANLYPNPAPTPNPFWNNQSSDGSPVPGNVGNVLNDNVGTALKYSSVAGANDPNVTFKATSPADSIQLQFTYAGNASTNQLFIYDVGNTALTQQVFAGGTSLGTSVTVTVPNTWTGYGYELVTTGGNYLSGSSPNFAFFAPGTPLGNSSGGTINWNAAYWYVGVEDLPTNGQNMGDRDYQRYGLQGYPGARTPSVLLLGSGLLGLGLMGGGFRRKMKG